LPFGVNRPVHSISGIASGGTIPVADFRRLAGALVYRKRDQGGHREIGDR
jgi:hypothetical protein